MCFACLIFYWVIAGEDLQRDDENEFNFELATCVVKRWPTRGGTAISRCFLCGLRGKGKNSNVNWERNQLCQMQ
jgi:hypothetical protein